MSLQVVLEWWNAQTHMPCFHLVSEVSLSDKNLDSMVDVAWKASRLLLMDFKVADVFHDTIYSALLQPYSACFENPVLEKAYLAVWAVKTWIPVSRKRSKRAPSWSLKARQNWAWGLPARKAGAAYSNCVLNVLNVLNVLSYFSIAHIASFGFFWHNLAQSWFDCAECDFE